MKKLAILLLTTCIALLTSNISMADGNSTTTTTTKENKKPITLHRGAPYPNTPPPRPHMPAFVPYSCRMDGEYIYVESLGECGYATVSVETADNITIATDFIDDTDPATSTISLPTPATPGDYTITITTENGLQYFGYFEI